MPKGAVKPRTRHLPVHLLAASTVLLVAACGGGWAGPPDPATVTTSDAEFWLQDQWPTQAMVYDDDGDPVMSLPTCWDGNDERIGGCVDSMYSDLIRRVPTFDPNGWSYWQTQVIYIYGGGRSNEAHDFCFSLIPPYDKYPVQMGRVSCDDLGAPGH